MVLELEWDYHKGVLRNSVTHLIKKIDKGFFNIILIWGATRAGKSTLGFQIGDSMARTLGVSFNEDYIFFDTAELEKECSKGAKRQVFMLDEAAFDLTGEDWAKDAQKRLKTYFSVAAKYNQTFILIIPHIEELRKYFVINEHTRGIEVKYNRKTLERGYCTLYTRSALRSIYYLRKMNHYGKAEMMFGFKDRFPKKIPASIDIEKYEKRKDDAIKSQNEEESNQDTKMAMIWRCLDEGLSTKQISKIVKTSIDYVYRAKSQMKAST
jgi:hypothetical protein